MAKSPSKRAPVMDLDAFTIKPQATAGTVEAKPAEAPPARGEDTMLRTSIRFDRAVHDKLRLIAFEERCSITDLIHEGLDHVLQSRNYPTTTELTGRKAS